MTNVVTAQDRDMQIENHRADTEALGGLLDERAAMPAEDQAALDALMAEHRKAGADIAAKLFERNHERFTQQNEVAQHTCEFGSDDK